MAQWEKIQCSFSRQYFKWHTAWRLWKHESINDKETRKLQTSQPLLNIVSLWLQYDMYIACYDSYEAVCCLLWFIQVKYLMQASIVRSLGRYFPHVKIWNITRFWFSTSSIHLYSIVRGPMSERDMLHLNIMTSSNGNIFLVTGPLCGEFTGHRWIPLAKASDVELWGFLWSVPWINGWVNNCEAGDLRCHRAHYDVIVMT